MLLCTVKGKFLLLPFQVRKKSKLDKTVVGVSSISFFFVLFFCFPGLNWSQGHEKTVMRKNQSVDAEVSLSQL